MTKISEKSVAPENQSFNYRYVIDRAVDLAKVSNPTVLDFGCGVGEVVALARSREHTFFGADTFEGYYENWSSSIDGGAQKYVKKIEDGKIPFEDNRFDVVVANQVFEHIQEPEPALLEIERVLKPNGVFLVLFPVIETWFEPHLGLYFPHWMSGNGKLQTFYMRACRRIGFGYYERDLEVDDWVSSRQKILEDVVFYHRSQDFVGWCEKVFGVRPISGEVHYMQRRIEISRFKKLMPLTNNFLARWFLKFICLRRAGVVFEIDKSGGSS